MKHSQVSSNKGDHSKMIELTDYTEAGSSIIDYIDMWFFGYEGFNANVPWEAIAQTILRDKYNGETFEDCHTETIDECREKWCSLGKASHKKDKDSKCRRMPQEESDEFEKKINNRGYSGSPIILRGEVTHKIGY